MWRNGFKTAAAILAAAICLISLGCTESVVLETRTGAVTMNIVIDGAAGETVYEEATLFGIRQISVRPLDPTSDAGLGGKDLALLRESVRQIDLMSDQTFEAGIVLLAPGTYRVSQIELIPDGRVLALQDYDIPPPPASGPDDRTCMERAAWPLGFSQPTTPTLPTPSNIEGQPPNSIAVEYQGVSISTYAVVYADPATAPQFVITDGGSTTVQMTVDAAGLIGHFEESFYCQYAEKCSGGVVTYQPPCNKLFYVWPGVGGAQVFEGFIPLMQEDFSFSN